MEVPKWNDLACASKYMKMFLQIYTVSLDDPVGIRKASGANEHRGRSPPEDDTSYFELAVFERHYRSATRDRLLENDERSGLYNGTRGAAIQAPNKHRPRPEDNSIQTIQPSGDDGLTVTTDPAPDLVRQDHLMILPGEGKERGRTHHVR